MANWNSPYPSDQPKQSILYSSFSSSPKHLDPVISYNSNEVAILGQVYEPLLQYHYLKQPYTLEPLILQKMPEIRFLNTQGKVVNESDPAMAYSEYRFTLKKDILFQPHPAFVKDKNNQFVLHDLSDEALVNIQKISDFKKLASRPLVSQDFIYAIKRMAVRSNHSPILDTMIQYIVGLKQYSKKVSQAIDKNKNYDLRVVPIKGVKRLSDTEFSIRIKGDYPQFLYWLSMNFFAPIPWEAVAFYKQPGLVKKNITLDTYPVGTGPYMLSENNPNKRMHLVKNPNYHHGFYPKEGLASGAPRDLLQDAGKPLPFIDEVIYSLEKESVPLWNKFLQGYYDASGVSSDSFDQVMNISANGSMSLTQEMVSKGVKFVNTVEPTIFYLAFNMVDPVVGGYSEKQRKLRQALSIAVNFEEYISIFMNGRGVAAQGPIPPGITGCKAGKDGFNPVVYHLQNNQIKRRSIEEAKRLLAEAGYPNGLNKKGERLTLHYDTAAVGPDSKAMLNWYRKQFEKLGIELVIRATDYNRFQDKVRNASVQLFSWGWNADYPDPENFLFLLSGQNAVIHAGAAGINGANYDNPEFNVLFKQIERMPNSPERLKLIQKAVTIAQQDAPWAWGFYPKSLALYHSWYHNVWSNPLANNSLKYKRIDAQQRVAMQKAWNAPVLWPMILVVLVILMAIYPLRNAYQKRQKFQILTSEKTPTIAHHSSNPNHQIAETEKGK